MTCAPEATLTLALDGVGGWEASRADGLVGLDRDDGLRLAPVLPAGASGAIHRSIVEPVILPPWLATDGRGRWYLAAGNAMLMLDPCEDELRPLSLAGRSGDIVAATARPGLLALARRGRVLDTVVVYAVGRRPRRLGERTGREARLLGEADVERVQALAFAPSIELAVAHAGGRVSRVGLAGDVRPGFTVRVPGLPVGDATGLEAWPTDAPGWQLAHASAAGASWRRVHAVDPRTGHGRVVQAGELEDQSVAPGLLTITDSGVALRPGETTVSAGRDGRPVPITDLRPEPEPLVEHGDLVTVELDSGIDDCRWHRIVVDADEAPQARWSVDVISLAERPATELLPDDQWSTEVVQSGSNDGLVRDQPPGRYLRLRVALDGAGTTSARVRRVTLHAGRATSLDHLPAVYRADDDAADFTERFLAVFDAAIADVDEVIEHAPLLLIADALPDGQLPALARLLGIDVDPGLTPAELRRLLHHLPDYAPRAGTPAALSTLLQKVFRVTAAVEEHGAARPWAGLPARSPGSSVGRDLAGSRPQPGPSPTLGAFRLYGKARAAVILGSSRLGSAPLRADVDTAAEAGASGAHRCTIHVEPGPHTNDVNTRAAIERLIRWAVPAHVSTSAHFPRAGITLARSLRVGIDTVVLDPPAAALAGPDERRPGLGRTAVVGAADRLSTPQATGRPAIAGVNTTAR
jgi:phage tail-like protein